MKEKIIGDILEFKEHPEYKGESMKIVRKEIVEGIELKLRTHPDGEKWFVTWKSHAIALITKMQLAHEIYHLEFYYSKEGYTLIEDFNSLDALWEKTKLYISEFNL